MGTVVRKISRRAALSPGKTAASRWALLVGEAAVFAERAGVKKPPGGSECTGKSG